MENAFCSFITFSIDVMQFIVNLLLGVWSLVGIPVPDLRSSIGSVFGCNV